MQSVQGTDRQCLILPDSDCARGIGLFCGPVDIIQVFREQAVCAVKRFDGVPAGLRLYIREDDITPFVPRAAGLAVGVISCICDALAVKV